MRKEFMATLKRYRQQLSWEWRCCVKPSVRNFGDGVVVMFSVALLEVPNRSSNFWCCAKPHGRTPEARPSQATILLCVFSLVRLEPRRNGKAVSYENEDTKLPAGQIISRDITKQRLSIPEPIESAPVLVLSSSQQIPLTHQSELHPTSPRQLVPDQRTRQRYLAQYQRNHSVVRGT